VSEKQDDEEVRRAVKLIEAVMRVQGVTKKDLDSRLGKATGYFAQVLSGRLELKYRHVTSILRALSVDPGVFFRALYPEPEGEAAPAARGMERYLGSLHRMGLEQPHQPESQAAAPAIDPEELERRIRAAIQEALAARMSQRPESRPRPPGAKAP
jgi:hypothetical protein